MQRWGTAATARVMSIGSVPKGVDLDGVGVHRPVPFRAVAMSAFGFHERFLRLCLSAQIKAWSTATRFRDLSWPRAMGRAVC